MRPEQVSQTDIYTRKPCVFKLAIDRYDRWPRKWVVDIPVQMLMCFSFLSCLCSVFSFLFLCGAAPPCGLEMSQWRWQRRTSFSSFRCENCVIVRQRSVAEWVLKTTIILTPCVVACFIIRFGKIKSIKMLHESFCAFVNFEDACMAASAMEMLKVSCSIMWNVSGSIFIFIINQDLGMLSEFINVFFWQECYLGHMGFLRQANQRASPIFSMLANPLYWLSHVWIYTN